MAEDIDVSHYNTGTASVTAGATAVVGQGTTWTSVRKGDMFGTHVGDGIRILEIVDDTHLTLAHNWTGPNQTTAAYEIQRTPYDIGYLQRLEELILLLNSGNLEAFAGLVGVADFLPIFTGPGTLALINKADLTSGIQTDAEVEDMAGRAAFDAQIAGFLVLVNDVGSDFGPENAGRAALFYKKSNANADWSNPGYVTGPVGPMPNVEAGTITTGAPGTDYEVTIDPITGGYEINFTIPAPPGFYWENTYNPANTYALSSVVRYNGSSFIATQAVPISTPPSGAFPPVDTAYWDVLAARGSDGDIDGVTAFWQERITTDIDREAAISELSISVNPPQGRLTLTEGVAVPTVDVVGANSVHYVPAIGDRIPIFDGTIFKTYSIDAGLSLKLDPDPSHSGYHIVDAAFDVFIAFHGSTLRIGTGPAWATAKARNAQVKRNDGIWVNSASIVLRYGSGSGETFTVDAEKATLLGTIATDTIAGQVSDNSFSRRHVSNLYNAVLRPLIAKGDGVAHTYSINAFRLSGLAPESILSVVQTLPGASFRARASSGPVTNNSATRVNYITGIGIDSTTEPAATQFNPGFCTDTTYEISTVDLLTNGIMGITKYNWLEYGAGSGVQTWSNSIYSGIMMEIYS